MAKVLIIGAGGVGNVVVHKCAQVAEVFDEIVLASRTKAKCDAIAAKLSRLITTEQVDADDVDQMVALIKKHAPELVLNVALPYQDLNLMEACLEADLYYLDTANYEPRDEARAHPEPPAAPPRAAASVRSSVSRVSSATPRSAMTSNSKRRIRWRRVNRVIHRDLSLARILLGILALFR